MANAMNALLDRPAEAPAPPDVSDPPAVGGDDIDPPPLLKDAPPEPPQEVPLPPPARWTMRLPAMEFASGGVNLTLRLRHAAGAPGPNNRDAHFAELMNRVRAAVGPVEAVARLKRLRGQLAEAEKRKAVATAKVTELTARREVLVAEAGPKLAQSLIKLDKDLAARREEAKTAAEEIATLTPLMGAAKAAAAFEAAEAAKREATALKAELDAEHARLRQEFVERNADYFTLLVANNREQRGTAPWVQQAEAALLAELMGETEAK